MHGLFIHYTSCQVGKVCFPLNKSIPLTRTTFSKSRSENLEMTEHSIVTPGNLDFYSNHNNLIRVRLIDCYCPFFWPFCKISINFFCPMNFSLHATFTKSNTNSGLLEPSLTQTIFRSPSEFQLAGDHCICMLHTNN